MRNADQWTPSKYVMRGGTLRASADTNQVAVGSRLAAELSAARYQKYLPEHATGRLLDLGCGSVPLFGVYREHVTEVVTLDWNESPHARHHVDVLHDLNQPLPFSDGEFDTVVLSDVLEHVCEPGQLCAEIARVLSPGGQLIGSAPFLYWIHEAPHDFFRYTEFGLRHLLESSELQIEVLDAMGGSFEIWADLLAKHLAQAGPPGRALAAVLQSIVVSFGKTPPGRALSRRSSTRFALGCFFVASR